MTQTLVGRYELTTLLGRGGMGQVWEAVDRQLSRKVAVKLLADDRLMPREDYAELVRRFTRESTLTAGLQHPGVPTVHDAGSYDGGLYLVMELVEGRTISDIVADQGALPAAWTAAVGAQVCAVLAAAHERGLVHRDIKPGNLMVGRDGAVKVLDFGVASVLDAVGTSRITRTGAAIGTPAYMAPEQLHGDKPTPSTDLYALGCVLYEMLAGRQVFDGPSAPVVIYKHLQEQPAPLDRSDLPYGLEWLVCRLLAKESAQRPADAREVYEQLLGFMGNAGPLGDMGAPASDSNDKLLYARVVAGMHTTGGRPGAVAASPAEAAGHGAHPSWRDPGGPMPPAVMTPGSPGYPGGSAPGAPVPGGPVGGGPIPGGSVYGYGGPVYGGSVHGAPVAGGLMHGGSVPSGQMRGGPTHPGRHAVEAPPRGVGWKLLHSLWILPSLFFGFFTWVGFFYIATRHSSRKWLITGLVYFVLTVALFTLFAVIPEDSSPLDAVGGAFLFLMWFGGILHCLYANLERLRLRSTFGLPGAVSPAPFGGGGHSWPGQPMPGGGQHHYPYGS